MGPRSERERGGGGLMAIKGDVFLALQIKSQPTRGGGEEKESGDSRTGLEFHEKKYHSHRKKKPQEPSLARLGSSSAFSLQRRRFVAEILAGEGSAVGVRRRCLTFPPSPPSSIHSQFFSAPPPPPFYIMQTSLKRDRPAWWKKGGEGGARYLKK